MLVIDRFDGEFRWLSNFFHERDGSTVEHEFQADKTNDPADKEWILHQGSPGRAKRAGSKRGLNGRKITLRDDWEEVKVDRMRLHVRRKFRDSEWLRKKMIATHPAVLIEGNNWHDTFWGVCDGTCRFGPHAPEGDNELGKILMQVRVELIEGRR